MSDTHSNWRRTRLAFLAFAAIGATLLIAEHRAHVVPYLPWLLLLACPLMHVFHHGRRHHHGKTKENDVGSTP